jgi:hypothetical protein
LAKAASAAARASGVAADTCCALAFSSAGREARHAAWPTSFQNGTRKVLWCFLIMSSSFRYRRWNWNSGLFSLPVTGPNNWLPSVRW